MIKAFDPQRRFLEDAFLTEQDTNSWYSNYGQVISKQLYSIEPYLLKKLPDQTLIKIIQAILSVSRFFEGISWGYSTQLPHDELNTAIQQRQPSNDHKHLAACQRKILIVENEENILFIKVTFNQIQEIKYSIKQQFSPGECLNSQKQKFRKFLCTEQFQICYCISSLDQIVTYRNGQVEPFSVGVENVNKSFMTHPIFKFTYLSIKSELQIFLQTRLTDSPLLSVEQLVDYMNRNAVFDKQKLHQLKFHSNVTKAEVESQFCIDNTKSVFILQGSAFETRVLMESFLQQETKQSNPNQSPTSSNFNYKCCVYHVSLKRNKLTCDTYFIIKHIMFQITDQVPEIRDFLKLCPQPNLFDEMISPWQQNPLRLQEATPQTFIDFLKLIGQLHLDLNLVVMLHGIENVFDPNDLENFVYILRAASNHIPSFLKFVFSVERRENNFMKLDRIYKLLMTRNVINIDDQDLFVKESSTFLQSMADLKLVTEEKKPKVLELAENSYKSLIEVCNECIKHELTYDNWLSEYKSYASKLNELIQENFQYSFFLLSLCKTNAPIDLTMNNIKDIDKEQKDKLRDHLVTFLNENGQCLTILLNRNAVWQVLKQQPKIQDMCYKKTINCMFIIAPKNLNLKDEEVVLFQNFSTYSKTFCYYHEKTVGEVHRHLSPQELYEQLIIQGSYSRLIKMLSLVFSEIINIYVVALKFVGQTLQGEIPSYCDFYTQLKARLPDEQFVNDLKNTASEAFTYFNPKHLSLRENLRVDLVVQFPPTVILSCKFLADKYRVVFSLSCGLCLLVDTIALQVQKIFVLSSSCHDLIKIVDDRFLMVAGMDDRLRVFNMDTEKLCLKFHPNSEATFISIIQVRKDILYSCAGNEIVKWRYKTKEKLSQVKAKCTVLHMKLRHNGLLTCQNQENGKFIIMYDLDLNLMFQTSAQLTSPLSLKKFISLSKSECLLFLDDGDMVVLNTEQVLERVRAGSIFNLKGEDCKDIILIKSKEHFFFTIESQKMEFYTVSNFKKSDTWDYFFPYMIQGCDKNKEGSKICVWDTSAQLSLFNFLKATPPDVKKRQPPAHRRVDLIQCLDMSQNQVISCSLDRELRVWDLISGKFMKKYDLASFTQESITSLKLSSGGMLFLGSKDSNVYLIDIVKGKLCIVYEGHWSRVNMIYSIPQKDILITVSESNIKVWDLEYDECIKNMNEHTSCVIYCKLSIRNDQNIVTISQNYEYKVWNYTTGAIEESCILNLPTTTQLVVADINDEGKQGYFALENNSIVIYSFEMKFVLAEMKSHRMEDVIFIEGRSTDAADYLIVTTRTSCILYLLCAQGIARLSAYILNSRKTQNEDVNRSKYSYSTRFYFTTCLVSWLNDANEQKHTVDIGPLIGGGDQTDAANESIGGLESQKQDVTGQMNFNDLDVSKNIEAAASPNKDLDNSVLKIEKENTISFEPNDLKPVEMAQPQTLENTTKIFQSNQRVCGVFLGDSRGILHMTTLNLQ